MRREVGQDELDSCWVRFWEKVDVRGPGDCWEWKGARNTNGYGQLRFGVAPLLLAHRVVWRLLFGEVPDGAFVLHRCDDRLCVNPGHLWLGSQAENILDAVAKERSANGSYMGMPRRKLTREQVDEIRRRWAAGDVTQVALAREFGVGNVQIHRIVHEKRWPSMRRKP